MKLFFLTIVFILAGCNDNSVSETDTSSDIEVVSENDLDISSAVEVTSGDVELKTETGIFLDSAVSNIGYRTETLEGVTNDLGEYQYVEGETVTFFIGSLVLPTVTAKAVVTPLDLADTLDTSNNVVVNIIRLLQTLDEDGDLDNGISITESETNAAAEVDFTLSISEFELSQTVLDIVSGSVNSTLVSENIAIANFEEMLLEEGIAFSAHANISGIWTNDEIGADLLAFTFLADGTYFHTWVNLGPNSGMEWGTYVRDNETGQITVTPIYNADTGSALAEVVAGNLDLFTQVSGDLLTLDFRQVGGDNTNPVDFLRSDEESDALLGTWRTEQTDNELLAFIFFADGSYLHLEVDEQAPIDQGGGVSGMEWGTYSQNSATGQLTVSQVVDQNGDSGFSFYTDGNINIFAETLDEVLNLQFDEDNNDLIEEDEILELER